MSTASVAQVSFHQRIHEVPQWKKDTVERLSQLIKAHEVIGIASLQGISSSALQEIRATLRGIAVIKVAKNTLKIRALQAVISEKPGLEKLIEKINGSIAFILTNENPFKIQKILRERTVPAEAKVGQIAPVDVVVPKGNTGLDPGPVIGELNRVGIETRIENRKIHIAKDSVILKAGDVVTEDHYVVLNRLGIKPFKVGLEIQYAYYDGEILEGQALIIDEEKTLQELVSAYQRAFSLAIGIGYVTPQTLPALISKAVREARALSVEAAFPTKETIGLLMAKSIAQAKSLKEKAKFDE